MGDSGVVGSRVVRSGLWIALAALLVAGVGAATAVDGQGGSAASGSELAVLRAAPAVLRAEQQVVMVQQMSLPAGMTMTCAVVRPVTRCEQRLPVGTPQVTVSSGDGRFMAVPEFRRGATNGKAWVHAPGSGDGSFSTIDGMAGVLGTAKAASIDRVTFDGAPARRFGFEAPTTRSADLVRTGSSLPTGLPSDAEMSATIEAWIDDVGRPLRIVTHAVMTSSAASTSITMTHSFTYGPVPAIAVPSLDDAFPVATFAEAIRLLYA